MSEQESERPMIIVPDLCPRHLHDLVVHKLKLHEWEPWRSRVIVAQILLFQHASNQERVWRRAERDSRNLSLVLAELGCLACWDRDGYRRAIKVLRRSFEHAAQVSQGKASDPDWDVKISADTA